MRGFPAGSRNWEQMGHLKRPAISSNSYRNSPLRLAFGEFKLPCSRAKRSPQTIACRQPKRRRSKRAPQAGQQLARRSFCAGPTALSVRLLPRPRAPACSMTTRHTLPRCVTAFASQPKRSLVKAPAANEAEPEPPASRARQRACGTGDPVLRSRLESHQKMSNPP